MAQITGRVFVSVGGKRLRSKEGAKINLGGVEREAVTGDDGVHGYQEKVVAPSIDCTISHTADTSLKELQNITDTSVMFETDTGKVFNLRNAWCAKALELSKGEVGLTFQGVGVEES